MNSKQQSIFDLHHSKDAPQRFGKDDFKFRKRNPHQSVECTPESSIREYFDQTSGIINTMMYMIEMTLPCQLQKHETANFIQEEIHQIVLEKIANAF